MRISGVKELLEKLQTMEPGPAMFRGQSKDWPLRPAIGRYPAIVRGYESWEIFHEHVIKEFLRLARPHFDKYPTTEVEAWVEAQHHGVPTRLLDTTTNPLKALFFAVCDPNEKSDGILWAFEYASWRQDLDAQYKKYWSNELNPFLPPQYTQRLTAQEGAFISCPLPNNTDPMPEIDKTNNNEMRCIKFIIPGSSKTRIRRELRVLGCQHRLLFPDLDGVAKGILLSEFDR